MNSDEIGALVRSLVNTVLTSTAVAGYVNGSQATALAAGAGVLATLAYGVYVRWNTRKVPETAVVTSLAPTVAVAKAASIAQAK